MHKRVYSGYRSNGNMGTGSSSGSMRPNDDKDYISVLNIFKKTFLICPKEVLSQCIDAWKMNDWIFSVSASVFFERILLSIPPNDQLGKTKEYNFNNKEVLAVQVLKKHFDIVKWLYDTASEIFRSGNMIFFQKQLFS